ncbi:MAG: PspC domain-containing protein [Bacteroidales bacterium]|nr:PspC domain-containing protein [Bacteroidales bacterium]MBN2756115.1 PspC domain-containing protein [Bacteroidales bacterium]
MKKTIRINISGLIFNLDEDAYGKLQHYLNSITNKFLNTEDGNEVIADVESRIAELFNEKVGDRKEVINMEDIDYIIEIMGKPEDFEEYFDEEVENKGVKYKSSKSNRRVYRDPDNRVLSGLSAGIAAYLGIDPVIVRVVFVLATLFYGASLLIYILLWIIIPEAKTTSQKLEMRGQDVNLSNIEKSIKDEFTNVKSNFSKWQNSPSYSRFSENVASIINLILKIGLIALKVVLVIIGIYLFVVSLGVLGGLTGVFFFNDTIISPFTWNDMSFSFSDFVNLFADSFTAVVGIISVYLLIIIPALWVIYLSLKLIFRFKVRTKAIGIIAAAIWVVSFVVIFAVATRTAYNFKSDADISKKYDINYNSDTLFLELINSDKQFYTKNVKGEFGSVYVDFENDLKLSGKPRLFIEKSETAKTTIEVIKESRGMTKKQAYDYVKNINYDWLQNDSLLKFNSYFDISDVNKIRGQKVNVYLKIPIGKVVYIGGNLDKIIYDVPNVQDIYDWNMTNEYWIMTKDGLSLIDSNIKTTDIKAENIEEDIQKTKEVEELEEMKKELDSM